MSHLIQATRPGVMLGDRPERKTSTPASIADELIASATQAWIKPANTLSGFRLILDRINAEEQRLEALDPSAYRQQIRQWHQKLQCQPLTDTCAEQLFAAIRVSARYTHKVTLHDEQLFAAWAMLHGNIVEMNTGEGKP